MTNKGFSELEMKERFQKYGIIYTAEDIKEELEDLIGLEEKKEIMSDFFLALKKYEEIASNLAEAKMAPNFTMLLYGPPGTGKTAITRSMAKKYNIPMGLVEADRLVSPLLGDTIKNIRNVFDLAAEIVRENGPFLLFFDELDSVTGERGNAHEVGEIKRAVIAFLQIIDRINYEGIPLAIFGATNHEKQLDSAVWRRFTYHLKFDFPNFIIRKKILESFLNKLKSATIGIDSRITNSINEEYNAIFSLYKRKKEKLQRDLTESELLNLFEKIFEQGKADILYITQGYTGADLERGIRVCLLKAIQKSMLDYEDFRKSIKMVGGTKKHVQHAKILAKVDKGSQKSRNNNNFEPNSNDEDIDDLSDLDIDI